MNKIKSSLLFIIFQCFTLWSQEESINDSKYQFAKGVFEHEYKYNKHPVYKGRIEEDSSVIRYDKKVIILLDLSDDYKLIFTLGILNTDIIAPGKFISKTTAELSQLNQPQQILYNMTRNDSLTIGFFDELKLLNPNPKTKRFIFWQWFNKVANPTECYFELQNKKATRKTTLREFIKGSKVTFYYKGTIII